MYICRLRNRLSKESKKQKRRCRNIWLKIDIMKIIAIKKYKYK